MAMDHHRIIKVNKPQYEVGMIKAPQLMIMPAYPFF